MQKEERHRTIRALIEAERISRQEIVVDRLRELGQPVTQASVSRDLEELGILKVDGIYQVPHTFSRGAGIGLVSLHPAGENLLVAKCEPGLASAIAVRIDAASIDEIVGSVAGDDTIFLAVKNSRQQSRALKEVWRLFEASS